jgi:hypothetical protein
MSSFTPPLVQDRPTYNEDSSELQRSLWQHFENRYRGVNVWILSDGSVVQDTATAENSNTDMSAVYPWNVSYPADPYVRSVYIDAGANPQVATDHSVSHDPYPVAFFQGGCTTPITPAQVTLLTNYTAYGTGYAGRIS